MPHNKLKEQWIC